MDDDDTQVYKREWVDFLEIILPEHPWKIKRKSDEYFF